jgi:hypothetical protein
MRLMEMIWHGTMDFGWLFYPVIVAAAILLLLHVGKTLRDKEDNYKGRYMETLKERFT